MLRPRTLTERVVWAVTTTVALLVGLQSMLAFIALHVQEDELTDGMLRHEVQQIVVNTMRPGLTPTGPLIESTRLSAWLVRGGAGAAAIPAEMRDLAPGLYQFKPAGKTLHVAVTDTEDGRLTVILDATGSEARVFSFGLTLLGIWIGCVVATVWIARRVAAVAVEPIVAATRDIARTAPGEPLLAEERSDETGVLMETFNRFRDRVDDMVAREREFAANLDHEIRTPLTTIRTDAELLLLDDRLDAVQQGRLASIIGAVDEITATARSTLSYSAGRSGVPEAIDLRELVQTACGTLGDRAAARGLRIAVDVGAGAVLRGDRQALLTIVRNILRNATEHAAPATLKVFGDQKSLTFADDGPGIPPNVLAHVFDRHRHGHRADERAPRSGIQRGLGLAIARRLCEMQGWALTARSPVEGATRGAAFVLDLAP
jgi:signal transduction histidine kinase